MELDYRLCYVDNIDDWNTFQLYFTSKYEGQWGDDWNDRPACSNAGTPYTDDREIYSIIVEFDGCGSITFGGKLFSVEDINKNKASWIVFENIYFDGGETLKDIISKINNYNKVKNSRDILVYKEVNGDDF